MGIKVQRYKDTKGNGALLMPLEGSILMSFYLVVAIILPTFVLLSNKWLNRYRFSYPVRYLYKSKIAQWHHQKSLEKHETYLNN